ncbi:TPA: glycosyltransferase family 2 protein [Yersinia enterocolitica]|nr:glycosyltransferase [Yersinia enterocolitica]HDY4931233.1 glycosyltransferase [Yersinia enterocolitica]HEC1636095.1 glycosyltransferase [Yersinia enterocolitica]HED0388503.1 glycosyltransferase [Yersinia enterocolitica]
MKNNELVSIIIATYNVDGCISACLDSVLSQSYENYEIIIVDGMSTDKSLDVIKSYTDSRIRLYSEKDKGIYDAWNKGVNLAKGQWLLFIGADDIFYSKTSLATLVNAVPDNNETLPIIYGKIACEGPSGNITSILGEPWFDVFGFKFNHIYCNLPMPIMSAIYSRKFIGEQKFDINMKVSADAELLLRCLRLWKGLAPKFIDSNEPIVIMGYGGVSTNYKTHFITFKESLASRKKNGISNINCCIAIRFIKIIILYFINVTFGKNFFGFLLNKYHELKRMVMRRRG